MTTDRRDKQRITVRIQSQYIMALDNLLARIHLRRDAYLNAVLPDEVEDINSLRRNSDSAAKYLRQMRGSLGDKRRIAVTLDSDLVQRMNEVCKCKGIVRDAFLEQFIEYLVLGDHEHESCISPLVKAEVLLSNPRHEYDYSHHPYESLVLSDDDLKTATRLPKNLNELFDK